MIDIGPMPYVSDNSNKLEAIKMAYLREVVSIAKSAVLLIIGCALVIGAINTYAMNHAIKGIEALK